MNDLISTPDDDGAIVKASGKPKNANTLNRREAFSLAKELVAQKLREGFDLCEEYARAKVAQESNAALKTIAEAGELAARKERHEANADLVRQMALKEFGEALKAGQKLEPLERSLYLAKIMASNPDIAAQLDVIEGRSERLKYEHGTQVSVAAPPAVIKSQGGVVASGQASVNFAEAQEGEGSSQA